MLVPTFIKEQIPFHFYIVQDSFVGRLKHILNGKEPEHLTMDSKNYLIGKGTHFYDECHTYIMLYGLKGNPYFNFKFLCDHFFLI
jgi:hypothetical protein